MGGQRGKEFAVRAEDEQSDTTLCFIVEPAGNNWHVKTCLTEDQFQANLQMRG